MKFTEIFSYANSSKKEIGSFGEDFAVRYIKKQGYKILDRNYNVHHVGELDIVAMDGEYVCFVEVRLRSRDDYGTPAETVTPAKIKKIVRAAQCYVLSKGLENACIRFDVVEVYGGRFPKAALIKDAFWAKW